MKTLYTRDKKGFSIVEMIVVIAIISMLLAIVTIAILDARKNSRDKQRVADLAIIEFAFSIYKNKNRAFPPSVTDGVEIGVGNDIDDIIKQYSGNIVVDPKTHPTDKTFGYYYDADFTCYESNQSVIFVRTMEQGAKSNFTELCTDSAAETTIAGEDSYIVILK